MRNIILFILSTSLVGCVGVIVIDDIKPSRSDSNSPFVNFTVKNMIISKEILDQFITYDSIESKISEEILLNFSEGQARPIGDSVGLYKELLDIFNPDQFDCGYDKKLKKKLQKIKPQNRSTQEQGFIPKVVTDNAFYSEKAVKIRWGAGSSILAHGFYFRKQNGDLSKYLFARNSPTVQNFDELDYFELNPRTYPHFIYTLDCSGYLSLAVNANFGIQKNSLKASASHAIKTDGSLMVVGGLMYSPLYQAFKGEGIFKSEDKNTVKVRIAVLKSILNEIPVTEMLDTTQIFLNSNYLVLFASNKGSASFNGEADGSLSAGLDFLVGKVTGSANASAKIQRSSTFTKYNTYFVKANIQTEIEPVTISRIKNLIKYLGTKVD